MRTARTRGTARQNTDHQLLGVPHNADLETIKRAYRQLAREVHPDTNQGDPLAAERFQKLTLAYENLTASASAECPPSDAAVEYPTRKTQAGSPPATVADPSDVPPEPGPAARPRHNIFAEPPLGTPRSRERGTDRTPPPPRHRPDPGTEARSDADAPHVDPDDLLGTPVNTRPQPFELPPRLADGLIRCLLLAPLLWATTGFAGAPGRELAVGPPVLAACTIITLVGWVGTGAFIWSRAPSMPRELSWWRSPGWDATPLAVRLLLFYVLVAGSSVPFLTPHLDRDSSPPGWTLGLWAALVVAAWVISGHVPAQMGYESRHDRYWRLSHNGLPRRTYRGPR